MKMIQPNCRIQFAAEDIEFIASVLGRKLGAAECLIKLLADEESRDLILDDEALFHALLERRGCLRVSSRFYFYILVRHVFRRSDLQERAVADYVLNVLAERFQATRKALNDISDRLFSLGEPNYDLDLLLNGKQGSEMG